ncbi:hypothetical protein BT69DRAFT_1218647 [Atractiella rhizophila]|nr:hypothetical protein BT69DRAFT_1218647 [Atractiella rhizophila]
MLNEAVTSAAHQEFQFVGALKRGRPKGSVKKEPTVYTCQFPGCGKEFPKLYSLKSHQTAHQTAKGFSCRFCDAKFNRAHDQKRHERLHEATKVYVCQGCNKDFTRLDALKRHKTNLRVLPACKDTPIIKQDRTGPVPIDIPLNPSRAPRANSNASFPSSGTASHPMPAAGSGQQALHNFSNAHPGQRPPPQQFEFVNELPPPRKHIAPFPPLARATQGHRPSVNEEYDDESILMAQGEEHDEGGDIPVMNGNGEGDVED